MSRFVVVPNGFIIAKIQDDRLREQIKQRFIQVRNEASQHSDIHISLSDEPHELSVVGREPMLADVTIYDIYRSLLTEPSLVGRLDITSENLQNADAQLSARAQAGRERFNAYIPRFGAAYSMLGLYLNDDQYNGWIASTDARTVSAYRSHLEDARLAQQRIY